MDALIGHGDLCDYVKHARQIDGHLIFLSADNSFTILITPIIYMTFGWERCDTKCIKIPDVHKKLNGILIVQCVHVCSYLCILSKLNNVIETNLPAHTPALFMS